MDRERIGLLGGSFDPIHTGHLILAERAMDFAELSRVIFIPTAVPPHKNADNLSGLEQRKKMVELAIENNDRFELSLFEAKDEPAYTYESVLFFKGKGYERESLHLIVGSDSLSEMMNWKNPEVIFRNSTIISLERPGYEGFGGIPEEASIIVLNSCINSISSSMIRELVRKGRSIRYLVPKNVELFIRSNSLYTRD